VDDEQIEARREQAIIAQETAAAHADEARLEHDGIERAREAIESRDPETIAEAAADLHRTHALHEAKAGHAERSRRSLRRAAAAGRRLARLRRGR
jgi:hypothetical protein